MAARAAPWLLAALGAAMLIVRLLGPADLLDNDQLRPAAYAMDIIHNGSWLVQRDFNEQIASKPPVYAWLVAVLSLPGGRVERWTLYLPCAAAVTGAALLAWRMGARRFGPRAGLLGGLALLLSAFGFKHVALARTDAVFAFMVTLGAFFAWRAWDRAAAGGRARAVDWLWFWLAAAGATLTKGPLGVVLAAGGLVAVWWERRRGLRTIREAAWSGIVPGFFVFVALVGCWLWLAYLEAGRALIDTLIGRELVGHAVASGKGDLPLTGFYKPPLYFLSRFAPWSVFGAIGLWRAMARPALDDGERRLERFAACWFGFGMLVFCIAPHQRADHLLPILPAAAMLAGREVDRLLGAWSERRLVLSAAAVSALVLGVGAWWYIVRLDRQPHVEEQRRLASVVEAARAVAEEEGMGIVVAEDAAVARFFLNRWAPLATYEEAAEALSGEEPVVVFARRVDFEVPPGRRVRVIASHGSGDVLYLAAVTQARGPAGGGAEAPEVEP